MTKTTKALAVFTGVLALASPAAATDYFVSASGHDARDGRTESTAWQTIARANLTHLEPGDTLSFEGGQTFTGKLTLYGGCGTGSMPVVVQSYGTGRAIIRSAAEDRGLDAYNCEGATIRSLVFAGLPGPAMSTTAGIAFYGDQPNTRYRRVTIDNVEVSGFGVGVSVGAWNGTSGYDGLRITRVSTHDNLLAGISVWGGGKGVNRDVYIGDCVAYRNRGDRSSVVNSGNGIVIGQVDGGMIERSVAYDNGADCIADECAAGIWAYNSNAVTIQHNESFNNRTGSGVDGDGFDLDIGTTNSVMQYNYSHGNDGAGFLILQSASSAPTVGNIVRYNVSVGDGRRSGYGAVRVFGNVRNLDIYGNTLVVSGAPAFRMTDGTPTGVRLLNNIIVAGEDGVFTSGQTPGLSAGNHLYKEGTISADPQLNDASFAGTIGDARLLEAALTAYRLRASSPVTGSGADLRLLGIEPGPQDFFGGSLVGVTRFSAGAHQPYPSPRPPTAVKVIAAGG